jgi:hypothetical protein
MLYKNDGLFLFLGKENIKAEPLLPNCNFGFALDHPV